MFNNSKYLFLRKVNGKRIYSIPKCECCCIWIEKEVLMQFYPEQAASIEWVYEEVAKVHGNKYSSGHDISTSVSSLLLNPVKPVRV